MVTKKKVPRYVPSGCTEVQGFSSLGPFSSVILITFAIRRMSSHIICISPRKVECPLFGWHHAAHSYLMAAIFFPYLESNHIFFTCTGL